MGVPAFFRWLTRKYPSVIAYCTEQKSTNVNGVSIPIDSSEPNPNGVEFDNLYLDMNGIIHPCTHPEDKPPPRNEDEMMLAIFECIDRLFRIVRPRKVLYMAIDGVAPRAKMNQQRSRRFRSSKEAVEKVFEVNRVRAELLLKGAQLPPEKTQSEHFDSNCITPGTPFMARLSDCLHYYIHDRLNNDPGWRGIKVILSDANVPGEGEHKIMDFIRKQRAQPDHDPNTQHCLCGADADLIMLGLATHEPNFTIIREEFKPNKPRPCDLCGQLGHEIKECTGSAREENADSIAFSSEVEFIFVRLNVLREYLERDLQMPNLPFKYEFERAIDDWVFMCFFVGNDFLPHLPSLEIREAAIDRLITLYKNTVYKTGGYITENGDVNLERVQMILTDLGKAEDEIFKKRQQNELQFKAREKAKKRRTDGFNEWRPNWSLVNRTQFAPAPIGGSQPVHNARQEAYNMRKAAMHTSVDHQLQTVSSKSALESMMTSESSTSVDEQGQKRKREGEEEEEDHQANDEVRLWEDGFKDRYYESKFDVSPNNLEFRYNVALQYVRGLCWVLKYYYQGCASWKWYFPYHYAPFASDFVNISGLSTEFERGTKPFQPLEQLMSVFPASSRSHVPEPWAKLMTSSDSTIIDFYPEDFKIDLNGKKFAWQGVALLPFVDETRLFHALKDLYNKLTPAELKRNSLKDDRLYMSSAHEKCSFLKGLYSVKLPDGSETAISFDGMQGTVLVSENCVKEGETLNSPLHCLPSIEDNQVCTVTFKYPEYPEGFIFPATKLKGAVMPPKVLKPQDLDEDANRRWRPVIGMAPSTTRATLGDSGHRMLNHHTPRDRGGQYGNVPPPNFDNYSGGYNNQGNRNNYQNRDGYRGNSNYQGGGYRGNQYQGNQGGYQNYRGGGRGGYGYNRHQNRGGNQDGNRHQGGQYRGQHGSSNYQRHDNR